MSSINQGIGAFFGAILLASTLGCELVGPSTIRNGRIDYNGVIQRTNQQQTFVNLVRIYNRQPTTFVDITEVDAAVTAQASVTGGAGGIGAGLRNTGGQVGSVTGTLGYTESPTIRYQPLLGQALVSQLATPVSIENLSNLINSGWQPYVVLGLVCERVTLDDPDYREAALEDMQNLWYDSALVISTGKAQTNKPPGGANGNSAAENTGAENGIVSVQVNQNQTNSSDGAASQADSLVLFANKSLLEKNKLDKRRWQRLWDIYQSTQDPKNKDNYEIVLRTTPAQPTPAPKPLTSPAASPSPTDVHTGPDADKGGSNPGKGPVNPDSGPANLSPVIQTRSALGVLRVAIDRIYKPRNSVAFVTPDDYKCSQKNGYYHWLPTDPQHTGHYFLLIVYSQTPPPPGAYVSYFDRSTRTYYYIVGNDMLSQEAFLLFNLILTIQAVAGTPPLTPTISVGPRTGS